MIPRAAMILCCAVTTAWAAVEDCTFSGSQKPGRATVIDSGNSLRSDGQGPYVNGEKYSVVVAQAAWNIFPFRKVASDAKPQRHLIVDLDHPVPNGGGIPRGILNSVGGPHSYWHLDEKRNVHGVLDIPEGTTTFSELTAVGLASEDGATNYLLQMGPWSWQTCENSGPVGTAGTTRVIIARTGPNTWTVTAPAGSVGLLHDIRNPMKPVPFGLYYINFEIHYLLAE